MTFYANYYRIIDDIPTSNYSVMIKSTYLIDSSLRVEASAIDSL